MQQRAGGLPLRAPLDHRVGVIDRRCDVGQAEDEREVVVRGDAAAPLSAAAVAGMHDHLLAVRAAERRDRGHRAAAVARPVAGHGAVDVAGIKTERAMIAVATAGGQHADERATVAAAELLLTWARPTSGGTVRPCLGHWCFRLTSPSQTVRTGWAYVPIVVVTRSGVRTMGVDMMCSLPYPATDRMN